MRKHAFHHRRSPPSHSSSDTDISPSLSKNLFLYYFGSDLHQIIELKLFPDIPISTPSGAAIVMGPFQYLMMTSLLSPINHISIPGTTMMPKPLQSIQLTAIRCCRTSSVIHFDSMRQTPLQHANVSQQCCLMNNFMLNFVPIIVQPIQNMDLATNCSNIPAFFT